MDKKKTKSKENQGATTILYQTRRGQHYSPTHLATGVLSLQMFLERFLNFSAIFFF